MNKFCIAAAIVIAIASPAFAGKNTQAPHIMVQFSEGETIESVYAKLPKSIRQAMNIDEFRTQGQSTLKGMDSYEERLANATKGGGKRK